VRLAGVSPDEVTDIVISHAQWDHLGGIDLFPKAAVWIQKEAQERMLEMAGSIDRVIPGHDALQFKKFPTEGRIARIK
jgi:metal-dependent hydrolase (beta-lactamase superfamily II)